MIDHGDFDRKGLEATIEGLRDELRTERAYSQQLREQSLRDLRELRIVRQALHDLQLKLTHSSTSPGQTRAAKHPGLVRSAPAKGADAKELSIKS